VLNYIPADKTIDAALRLQPGTKHIVVVGGMSFSDIQVEDTVKEQLRSYEGSIDISYFTTLTMPYLLDRLHHLPDHTIVFYAGFGLDAAGTKFISGTEATSMVATAANAPVFVPFDVFLNHGEVGGIVSSLFEQGSAAGELALRILKGEKPQDIPRVHAGTIPMFDWRVLQRWGMRENDLPPGS